MRILARQAGKAEQKDLIIIKENQQNCHSDHKDANRTPIKNGVVPSCKP